MNSRSFSSFCEYAEAMGRPVPHSREETKDYWSSLPENVRRDFELSNAWFDCLRPDHNANLKRRAEKRMMRVDGMPRELREVVYEFGLEIVHVFLEHGVRKPASIKFLIECVRNEDYPNGQARFRFNTAPNKAPNPLNFDDDDAVYSLTELGLQKIRAAQ